MFDQNLDLSIKVMYEVSGHFKEDNSNAFEFDISQMDGMLDASKTFKIKHRFMELT